MADGTRLIRVPNEEPKSRQNLEMLERRIKSLENIIAGYATEFTTETLNATDITATDINTTDITATDVTATDITTDTIDTDEINYTDTYWDDLRFPVTSLKKAGVRDPQFTQIQNNGAGSTGVYAELFDDASTEEVFIVGQLSHKYKLGTNLEIHIHWCPIGTSTGDVVWQIEYTPFAVVNSQIGASTIVSKTQAGSGTALTHQLLEMASISGSAINSPSAMFLCRIARIGASGLDTFVGDAALLEVDIHYEIDSPGSREEYVK